MAEIYKTRTSTDFFNIKGLEARTGLSSSDWKTAILKELIDNALDAIEPCIHKQIEIEYINFTLKIFDNGTGLTINNIKDIYDFNNYASKNRHIITASRGKQGNGLKTIIGICHINNYRLFWHTSDGITLSIDSSTINDENINIAFDECGRTIKNGIEIVNIRLNDRLLKMIVEQYVACNPDVDFILKLDQSEKQYKAEKDAIDKTGETSLAFYSFQDLVELMKVQEDKSETYKSFLGRYFTTRIKNDSQIKNLLSEVISKDMLTCVKQDFETLRNSLNKKPFTLLRRHLTYTLSLV